MAISSSVQPYRQCEEVALGKNQILGMIRRNFKFLQKDIVVRFRTQLVRPSEYAVQAWIPHFVKGKDILLKRSKKRYRL